MLVSRHADAARVRARLSQLRQARPRRSGPELPPQRVHRRARARPDRAHAGDRRVEERGGAPLARRRCIPARLELPDGMVSGLYKYIVFDGDRALDRAGSTTRPATASWVTRDDLPNATGSRRTTGACRCTTAPARMSESDGDDALAAACSVVQDARQRGGGPRDGSRRRCSGRRRGAAGRRPRGRRGSRARQCRRGVARASSRAPSATTAAASSRAGGPRQRRPGVDPVRRAVQRRDDAGRIGDHGCARGRDRRRRRAAGAAGRLRVAVPWTATRWPAATTSARRRADRAHLLADQEERRRAPAAASTSSTAGVPSGCGPSSKVSPTASGPRGRRRAMPSTSHSAGTCAAGAGAAHATRPAAPAAPPATRRVGSRRDPC